MKRSKNRRKSTPRTSPLFKLAAFGTVGMLGSNAIAETTITFGGFTANNESIAGMPAYGDNVEANSADYAIRAGVTGVFGTPDIVLEWFGQWETYTDWDGRGNVAQSDFNGGTLMSILFQPTATAGVRLGSFELDEWAGGGQGDIAWSVTGPQSGTLASGNWTMGNNGGRSLLSPNVSGALGENLTLNLQLVSGAPSYFALDNLTFDQVPEPSTLALGALGAAALGAAAMRRRRRA